MYVPLEVTEGLDEAAVAISMVGIAGHDAALRSRLFQLEETLRAAAPGELDWDFWNEILELVEELPPAEEQQWKRIHLAKLRLAVHGSEHGQRSVGEAV